MIKMKKILEINRCGMMFSFLMIFLFSGCDEYQNCIKTVKYQEYTASGSLVIDTLYTRYGYRGMYKAVSKDKKDTLEIFVYKYFPKLPQKGDSIVKVLNKPYYTLYSKDSFFVMGFDCRVRDVVIFESGLIEDIDIYQIEEIDVY